MNTSQSAEGDRSGDSSAEHVRPIEITAFDIGHFFESGEIPNRIAVALAAQNLSPFKAFEDERCRQEEQAMQGWRGAVQRIHAARPDEHGDLIEGGYRSEIISKERLHAALHPGHDKALLAQLNIQHHAGMLSDKVPDAADYMQNGIVKYLQGEDGMPQGFYAIRTDSNSVREEASREYGWDPSVTYTAENLPESSEAGTLCWGQPKKRVAEVLNKITAGEVALPGDLVVFQGEEGEFRNKGNGKALKVTAYRYLPEDHYTLTQIFEILAIDGREVEPTILNLWSMRLNETLGGVDIGTIRKQITREDGVVLDVNMHIYMVRAGDVIACAEQDDEARGTPPTNISTLLDVPTVIDSEGMVD